MTTDLQKIVRTLASSRPLALWCVNRNAFYWINTLRKQYGVSPSCLIDSDANYHGKSFLGVPILAFADALARHPAMEIYAEGNYKFQIMGILTEQYGFPPERIINYEPVERRRSCMFVESAIFCVDHEFRFCCSDLVKKQSPGVAGVAFGQDYGKALREWTALRESLAAKLAAGEVTSCDGCCLIKEDYYVARRKIRMLNYSEGGVCNFNCAYCQSSAKNRPAGAYEQDIALTETWRRLAAGGLLADAPHVDISPGEPALHKKIAEMLAEIDGKCFAQIMTNASVYSEEIARSLSGGRASLCVSLDCGMRETFAALKGVDAFPRVAANLREYAKRAPGSVWLKYIFCPGRNDNARDVDGFAALVDEINPALTFLSYDIFHPDRTLPGQTFALVNRMIERLDAHGHVWKNISDVITRALAGELL
jgi:pyruvate-formate lyase-activating enzyme